MKKTKTITLFLLCFALTEIKAQQGAIASIRSVSENSISFVLDDKCDNIILKNGNEIKGKVTEITLNEIKYKKCDNLEGPTISIAKKDVFMIQYANGTKDVITFNSDSNKEDSNKNGTEESVPSSPKITEFKKRGYINITEINYSPGIGTVTVNSQPIKNADYSFGFKTVNGYQINNYLSLGIGLGIDKYQVATLVPITLDVRATIIKGQVSPVFNANIGYAVGVDKAVGGLVVNPSFGIKTYISKNVAYLFNVGYKWQAQEVTYYTYSNSYYYYNSTANKTTIYYQFITISTGFSF